MSARAERPGATSSRRREVVRRRMSYALMMVVLSVALTYGIFDKRDESLEDRIESVAATLQCPSCQNVSVARSQSSAARVMRREIGRRLEMGQSDEEIRTYFASRFGDHILLTPPSTGVGSLVWVLPVAVITVGAGGIALAFARWRRI